VLANLEATGETDIPESLFQLASMIKGKSLIMLFSDLLPTTDDWTDTRVNNEIALPPKEELVPA